MQQSSLADDIAQEPWRVLVVDDEPAITEEIVEFLTARGIEAVAAGDAAVALARVRADPAIMVMITDVRMPGRDGISLAAQTLAGRGDEQALEVVVLTGHASFDMAVDAVRTRVFDFVRKPVRLNDLAETVQRAHASAAFRRGRQISQARRAAELAAEARALRADIARLSGLGGPVLSLGTVVLPGNPGNELSMEGGRVLALINDELRTPLVPILGLAEMIERQAGQLPDDKLSEYGALIRQSGERLKEVAESFATLSALNLGTVVARKAPERAALILAALCTRHAAAAAQHGQTLVAAETPRTVLTDRRLLLQALDQLVSNALRFAPRGSEVRLACTQADGADSFEVADDGPGMSPAQVAEAMQPFHQLDLPTDRRHRGLGLGLTLARRLSEALGGRLVIRSAPGAGTSARIVLPAPQTPLVR